MKKVIAITLENIISSKNDFCVNNIPKYLFNKYNMKVTLEDINKERYSEKFNLNRHLIIKSISDLQAQKIYKEVNIDFIKNNYAKYLFFKIDTKVIDFFNKIDGDIVFILPETNKSNIEQVIIENLFKSYLKLNKVNFSKVISASSIKEKLEYLENINPDLLLTSNKDLVSSYKGNSMKLNYEMINNDLNIYPILNEIKDIKTHLYIDKLNVYNLKFISIKHKLLKNDLYETINYEKINKNISKIKRPIIYVSNTLSNLDKSTLIVNSKQPVYFFKEEYLKNTTEGQVKYDIKTLLENRFSVVTLENEYVFDLAAKLNIPIVPIETNNNTILYDSVNKLDKIELKEEYEKVKNKNKSI